MVLLSVLMSAHNMATLRRQEPTQDEGRGGGGGGRGAQHWYALPSMPAWPWLQCALGVVFVTCLTPALSIYALMEIDLALTVTLTSVSPIYALPLVVLMKGERPTLRASVGACVAVLGVVVLCMWGLEPT